MPAPGAHRTVATSYVLAIVDAAVSCGVDRAELLSGLPLTEADLAGAAGRVDLGSVRALWRRAIARSHDPHFGLHVGAHVRPGTFHVLGHAALNCRTLGEAGSLMLRYQRLVSEGGVLTLRATGEGRAVLAYAPQPAPEAMDPHQIEAILAGLVTLARWLTSPAWSPRRATFAHPGRGGDLAEYRRVLGCEVVLDAAEHALELDPEQLAAPIPYADPGLLEIHRAHADRLLADLPASESTADYARHWLRHADLASATEDALARSVHMSRRSFQRALQAEGSSWQALLDAARHERSLALLTRDDHTLEQIATRLGYSDVSSFVRAFRRWEGAPPRRHAREARRGPRA
jgi:AraC-like DNA-binding protein